jgi:hypothetical protein
VRGEEGGVRPDFDQGEMDGRYEMWVLKFIKSCN